MGFAGVRDRQQAAVFARLGEPAEWSGYAEPVPVRFAEEDEVAGFGDGSRLIMGALMLKVRRSNIATPAINDTVHLIDTGRRFRITSDAQLNRNGAWLCPVEEISG
ncbi:MAG: hypothetical protein JHC81_04865 [Brevundimonas sp.]|uniref:head-tail joining protein n=1 Tax=Brevundimonas sp. TaxID=1871086 RepID=UPI001A282E4F|nr:hypothetical protein [Brevundimonas sp.]MBJ7446846.1 hypothetical protein [Brevundimonas sp.]